MLIAELTQREEKVQQLRKEESVLRSKIDNLERQEKALEDNSKIASTILTQLAMQDPQLLTTFVLNKEKFDKHPDALVSIRDLLVGKDMQAAAALIQTIADN